MPADTNKQLARKRNRLLAVAPRHNVTNVRVFGSTPRPSPRGAATPTSSSRFHRSLALRFDLSAATGSLRSYRPPSQDCLRSDTDGTSPIDRDAGSGSQQNELPPSLVIERSRYSFEIHNPFSISCVDEITLLNTGGKTAELEYDLIGFKPHLVVFDPKGERLEFSQKNRCLSQNNSSDPGGSILSIRLPQPMLQNDYRTIRFEYLLPIPEFKVGMRGLISIPLERSGNVYVYIKLNDDFQFTPNYILLASDGERIDLTPFLEDGSLQLPEGDPFFSIKQLYSHIDIIVRENSPELKNLLIFYSFELPLHQKWWYDLGGAIGLISSTLVFLILAFPNSEIIESSIRFALPLATASITSMVIIRGWLFTRGMDKVVMSFDRKEGSRISYNTVYIFLCLLLLAEIIVIVYGVIYGLFPQ